MSRVVTYVFDKMFERKETVSYKEKRTVVISFFILTAITLAFFIFI
ncbi:MAG: hypothetical protein IPM74_13970 [Crocinitomicaceae bacterium]|nr:hypothetical protein [Crocinitomicaceae bacterium]MBK8926979.1 hypothetical protein [Crocinitomicaceae bacterium]